MTLFIAYFLIYQFQWHGGWYVFATLLWLLHLSVHLDWEKT